MTGDLRADTSHGNAPTTSPETIGHADPYGRPLPAGSAGTCDRALLLLAVNGLSRAALVGLDVEQIRFTTTVVELRLGAQCRPGRTTNGR